jgi:PAS domain S-box-containing protein
MNPASIPPIVMACISLYVAIYHFLIFSRIRERHQDLTFGLACITMALYALHSAGLYNAESALEGVVWQRGQVAAVSLLGLTFTWFLADYSRGIIKPLVRLIISAYFLFTLILVVTFPGWPFWLLDEPLVSNLVLPFGIEVTYYEMTPGPGVILLALMGGVFYLFILAIGIKLRRQGETSRGQSLIISMTISFVCLCNDLAIALEFYQFVYLLEYSCLGIMILMGHSLSDEILEAVTVRQALKASKQKLELVLRGANLGQWNWHVPSGRLQFDKRWAKILGYSVEETPSTIAAWERLVHPDDLAHVFSVLKAHWRDKSPLFECEYRLKKKGGEWLWILDRGAILEWNNNGKPIHGAGTTLDISLRKQAEDERIETEERFRQAQKMEAIGTLAGGMAHDMNNVLGAIVGLTELIKDDTRPDDERYEDLKSILLATRRGRSLTQNLLGFARKGKYRKERVSLNRTVEEVAQLLERTINKTIVIETHLSKRLADIEGDSSQLSHLLMNLCINAADAIVSNGRIVISTENTIVDERSATANNDLMPGHYIELSVNDNGCGIDKNTLNRIFEPFFTTKKPGKGTGLGLAMAYGSVQEHGGTMIVDSTPGEGTTVSIFLPTIATATQPDDIVATTNAHQPTKGKGRVLMVDDEKMIRQIGRRMLERMGFEVSTAKNGAEAVNIYKEDKNIDLVMLDLGMPVMDGTECFKRIREINPQARVLIVSGFAEHQNTADLLEQGAMGLLQKPFSAQGFNDAVTAAMGET